MITEYFVDSKQHCLFPRWYCRFMFWAKHGWFIKREYKSFDQMKGE